MDFSRSNATTKHAQRTHATYHIRASHGITSHHSTLPSIKSHHVASHGIKSHHITSHTRSTCHSPVDPPSIPSLHVQSSFACHAAPPLRLCSLLLTLFCIENEFLTVG